MEVLIFSAAMIIRLRFAAFVLSWVKSKRCWAAIQTCKMPRFLLEKTPPVRSVCGVRHPESLEKTFD